MKPPPIPTGKIIQEYFDEKERRRKDYWMKVALSIVCLLGVFAVPTVVFMFFVLLLFL